MILNIGDRVQRKKQYRRDYWENMCLPIDKIVTISLIINGDLYFKEVPGDWCFACFDKIEERKIKEI